MTSREAKLQRYPTTAELYAVERAAKAARAAEIARILRAMATGVKNVFTTRGLRHA